MNHTRATLPWLQCSGCGLHLSVPEAWKDPDVQKMHRRVMGAHRIACRGMAKVTVEMKRRRVKRKQSPMTKAVIKMVAKAMKQELEDLAKRKNDS